MGPVTCATAQTGLPACVCVLFYYTPFSTNARGVSYLLQEVRTHLAHSQSISNVRLDALGSLRGTHWTGGLDSWIFQVSTHLAAEVANPVFDSSIGVFNPPGIILNGQNTLDLKFLDSVLFDINCVQNPKGVYGCYVLCRRSYCSGFESDACFVTFVNFIDAAHAMDPRRNVTRRKQKWQRISRLQYRTVGGDPLGCSHFMSRGSVQPLGSSSSVAFQ